MPHRLLVALVSSGIASAQAFSVQTLPANASLSNTVSTGDVNGDGALDLVLAGFSSIAIRLGDGLGGFGPVLQPVAPIFFGLQTLVADGNGDGTTDIWVCHGVDQRLLLGDGAGNFTLGGSLGSSGISFVIGDLDEDGDPDVVTGVGSLTVARALNNGNGTFGPLVTLAQATLGFSFTTFQLGDVNGDGHVDIVARGILPSFTVLLGDGTGSFPTRYVFQTAPADGAWRLADLDADGDPDLAIGSMGTAGTQPAVWRNDGAGTFTFAQALPVSPLEAGDVDGDGHVDLVGAASDAVVVLSGDGNCGFVLSSSTATGPVRRPVLADFDRDGRLDVATVAQTGLNILVLRNLLPTPAGIAPYGSGTPTCLGTMGMWGTPEPAIGESGFRVVCSNAPPNGTGLLAMGTRSPNGWDPLGVGITLHLGFASPVGVMHSDAGGVASFALPIPQIALLAGLRVHVQSIWMGDPGLGNTCSPGLYELATSRGLTITLQN